METVGESDDVRCFNRLLDQTVRMQGNDQYGKMYDRTIAECLDALEGKDAIGISESEIRRVFRNCGLLETNEAQGRYLYVSNNNDWLKEVFANSPWQNWANVLRQLPNADNNGNKPERFNRPAKCVRLKLGQGNSLV